MNTKSKGSLNERRVKKYFEGIGYSVIKAGASLGVFDLVAISDTMHHEQLNGIFYNFNKVLLIQVKSNRMPPIQETAEIVDFNNFPHGQTQKLIVIIHDGVKSSPEFPSGKKRRMEIKNLTTRTW